MYIMFCSHMLVILYFPVLCLLQIKNWIGASIINMYIYPRNPDDQWISTLQPRGDLSLVNMGGQDVTNAFISFHSSAI